MYHQNLNIITSICLEPQNQNETNFGKTGGRDKIFNLLKSWVQKHLSKPCKKSYHFKTYWDDASEGIIRKSKRNWTKLPPIYGNFRLQPSSRQKCKNPIRINSFKYIFRYFFGIKNKTRSCFWSRSSERRSPWSLISIERSKSSNRGLKQYRENWEIESPVTFWWLSRWFEI